MFTSYYTKSGVLRPESAARREYRRTYVPYCLQKVSQNPETWVVLNRRYKPLGQHEGDWVDYAEFARPMKVSRELASRLSHKKVSPEDWEKGTIWLYDDNPLSRKGVQFEKRLVLLEGIR